MVFSLKLFGGARLESADGPLGGRAVQRGRMALLALLASARERGMTRDKLIAYLWPDADTERGRRYLSDSVYRINQAIGAEAITSVGDALCLDTAALWSDVAAFEDALARGDFAAAVTLYAGPYLDGFFLPDALEFDRWSETERERLRRLQGSALEALAEAAGRAGHATVAAEWWQRRAALDPLDARVAIRLMQALDAAGQRGAALRHAQLFTALLREEVGADPDPEVARYAAQLRSGPESLSTVSSVVAAGAASPTVPPGDSGSPRRSRAVRMIGLAAAAVVIPIVALWLINGGPSQSAARDVPVAVAVLPFIDLSPAKDQEYFSDGITEELINALSRIDGVHVPSRTSVFAYKGRGTDIREIGRQLGASHIVEGSVRRTADRFRIAVQLVNVADGYHLWTETYDGQMKDVLTIEMEIARAVVAKLQGTLVGDKPASPSHRDADVHPEAFDMYMRGRHALYLKGRYAWYQRTEEGLQSAVGFFQQAVNKEPSYARAHAGLADAYAVLGFYDYLPAREAFGVAERAATRALELEPTLAAPHATLGYINLYHHWNWDRAEAEFRRAIALDPSYSTAHQWYANFLTAMGRFEDAERSMRRAQELDPLSLIANAALGWVFYYAGAFEASAAQCRHTLELDSRYAVAMLWRGWALEELGQANAAIELHERAVELTSRSALYVASLARAQAVAGDRAKAAALLDELEARVQSGWYVPPYELARIHAALGDTDRAFESLDRALALRSHSLVFLNADPQLRSLRSDPRYARLVARVGLPPARR